MVEGIEMTQLTMAATLQKSGLDTKGRLRVTETSEGADIDGERP